MNWMRRNMIMLINQDLKYIFLLVGGAKCESVGNMLDWQMMDCWVKNEIPNKIIKCVRMRECSIYYTATFYFAEAFGRKISFVLFLYMYLYYYGCIYISQVWFPTWIPYETNDISKLFLLYVKKKFMSYLELN